MFHQCTLLSRLSLQLAMVTSRRSAWQRNASAYLWCSLASSPSPIPRGLSRLSSRASTREIHSSKRKSPPLTRSRFNTMWIAHYSTNWCAPFTMIIGSRIRTSRTSWRSCRTHYSKSSTIRCSIRSSLMSPSCAREMCASWNGFHQ